MFQTVAIPQSQLRCCAVGAVRAICEAESGFQKQLLALWCLHLGSLLHTDVAQPPRSQMTPLAWCPTVDTGALLAVFFVLGPIMQHPPDRHCQWLPQQMLCRK